MVEEYDEFIKSKIDALMRSINQGHNETAKLMQPD